MSCPHDSRDPRLACLPPGELLSLPLRGYQRWVSPLLPARCRFHPTCSSYAIQALRTRGALVGLLLTGWRLLRCQPFHPGGYDPVPPRRQVGSPGQRRHPAVRASAVQAPAVQRLDYRPPTAAARGTLAEAGGSPHSC